MTSQTKIIISLVIFIFVLGSVGALFSLGIIELPRSLQQEVTVDDQKGDRRMDTRDAVSLARDRALEWHSDAVLAYSATVAGATTAAGHSDSWELIFTSPGLKDRGFRILIDSRAITTAEEIPYTRKGAAVPENLIPSQEAADYVRSLKGYENEKIISVELMYESKVDTWFWGVKTSKGIIAIKATP